MSGETPERNKDLVRHCIDVLWNDGAVERAGEFFHPAVRLHHERDPDADVHGIDALRAALANLRRGVEDGGLEVVRILAEGDRVMVYLSGRGTFPAAPAEAATNSAAPTPLSFTVTAIVRIADGLIAEIWLIADTLGLLQQLGTVRRFG